MEHAHSPVSGPDSPGNVIGLDAYREAHSAADAGKAPEAVLPVLSPVEQARADFLQVAQNPNASNADFLAARMDYARTLADEAGHGDAASQPPTLRAV